MDQQLINQIIERDRKALSLLYDRYEKILYNMLVSTCHDENQIEKILADIFREIWNNPLQFKNERISLYILKSCKNKMIDNK